MKVNIPKSILDPFEPENQDDVEIIKKLQQKIYNNFVDLIVDGLIHTYPIKTTVKLIKRDLNGIKANIDIEEETGTIFLKGYSDSININNIKIIIHKFRNFII